MKQEIKQLNIKRKRRKKEKGTRFSNPSLIIEDQEILTNIKIVDLIRL